MVAFVIRSGPPPPPLRKLQRPLSPIQQTIGALEVGQWFIATSMNSASVNTHVFNAKNRLRPRDFKQRKVEGGTLVIRVA